MDPKNFGTQIREQMSGLKPSSPFEEFMKVVDIVLNELPDTIKSEVDNLREVLISKGKNGDLILARKTWADMSNTIPQDKLSPEFVIVWKDIDAVLKQYETPQSENNVA